MANIVFVTDLLTGILVALVLLFISRIGFMLSLLAGAYALPAQIQRHG
jgi:hypothetical protein